MINITDAKNFCVLEAKDESGSAILNAPLHRVFFRSNLGGECKKDQEKWLLPFGNDKEIIIKQLIKHFEKYEIDFCLDKTCEKVIENITKRNEKYLEILKTGKKAKNDFSTKDHSSIIQNISDSFKRKLTEQQILALNHLLVVENGANFSVPGSGKTSVALAYFHILRKRKIVDSFFVIGPTSSFEPWEYEYKMCFGKEPNNERLSGKAKHIRREIYLTAPQYDFLLTTYDTTARDVDDMVKVLSRQRYLLILDESHYIKRPQGGIRAEAVLTLAEHAERKLILSGTPMPNGLPDLWTQFTFLWNQQKPLGDVYEYLRNIQQSDIGLLLEDVKKRVAPLFYRTTKKQLGLPKAIFKTISCEMSPLQKRIYKGVAARFLSQTDEAPNNREALRIFRRARTIRLLQIASNPSLLKCNCDEFLLPPMCLKDVPLHDAILHYSKFETPNKVKIASTLAKKFCNSGEKIIVWSTFIHNLKMLAKELKEFDPIIVHGGIPLMVKNKEEEDREHLLKIFKEDKSRKVLIANPAACAESISLHKTCHHAIYLDRSFNCAHFLQSMDRIHRLGLSCEQKTYYYLLVATDSIDEVIHRRLKEKSRNMEKIIESDLPGKIPGYWSDDLGDEEVIDYTMVEQHIKRIVTESECKT